MSPERTSGLWPTISELPRPPTTRPFAHAAARLARDAYASLLARADGIQQLSADDLHALGQCYEGVGGLDKANQRYTKSLEMAPAARTHLSWSASTC